MFFRSSFLSINHLASQVKITKFLSMQLLILSYLSALTYVVGTQKNRLKER